MLDINELIFILEEGINKYGEKPLTNKWLLNIIRKALERQDFWDNYPTELFK